MAVTKIEEGKEEAKKVRGESFKLDGKSHFVRVPKAKDMIAIEKLLAKEDTQFGQGLLTIAYLCDSLTYEDMLEVHVPDLDVVFEVFEKILPTTKVK